MRRSSYSYKYCNITLTQKLNCRSDEKNKSVRAYLHSLKVGESYLFNFKVQIRHVGQRM